MTPEFEDLFEGVESPEERARLLRVHELLQEAGPPPELSPALASMAPPEDEPTDEADVAWLPPRRLGAALVLAATLLLASFAVGYFAGNRSNGETEVPVASKVSGAPPVDRVMSPYCEVVCFAFGAITKFGCPGTPARLAMPHPSAHQSRVYEQGPMRSCF